MKNLSLLVLLFCTTALFAQNINYTRYNNFLQKYVSFSGNVNYATIDKDKAELAIIVSEFENMLPNEKATLDEKKAFWINSYNVHTLQLVIDYYPVSSLMDIKDAWKINFINYKGIKISLDYIENELLRNMNDPRIHFSINSASVSSPILMNEAYISAMLNKQMNGAALLFINDKTKNDISTETAILSKVFTWYEKDFASKTAIYDFINQFPTVKINEKTKISFSEFNFGLNY